MNEKSDMTLEKSSQKNASAVHDISHVKNKLLLSSIVTKSPPDLYFFCWLGFLKIEKRDIRLPFFEFSKNHVVFQAYMNLTQIRINKKQYNLLEPIRKGYKVKRHEIEASAITLSTIGRQIWLQAQKDGLWDVVQDVPRLSCLGFEDFTHYFHSHIFLSRTKFIRHNKELGSVSLDLGPKEKGDTDKRYSRGLQKLKELGNYSTLRSGLRRSLAEANPLESLQFDMFDILHDMYSFTTSQGVYDYRKEVSIETLVSNNPSARAYLVAVRKYTNKAKRKSLLKKLYKTFMVQIYKLAAHNFVEVYNATKGNGYKVKLTHKGKVYTTTGAVLTVKEGLEQFIYNHTSRAVELHRSKRQDIKYYVLIKLGTFGLIIALVFLGVSILNFSYQAQYNTPLKLLYICFSWLNSYIYICSLLCSLLITLPIHFIVSIIVFRKKRVPLLVLRMSYYSIVAISISLGISNLVFLFGF